MHTHIHTHTYLHTHTHTHTHIYIYIYIYIYIHASRDLIMKYRHSFEETLSTITFHRVINLQTNNPFHTVWC